MRFMYIIPLAVVAVVVFDPIAVNAQETSEQMTCDEAVAYFEEHHTIYTSQDGNVLPITQGTPIRQADLLNCSDGQSRFSNMLKTRDNPECVISAYCE